MGDYRVDLDIFSGPLDLLLYLIRKDEVDIYDISITRITDQYLRYVDMLKSLDIDLAGDFLVMAATLMQIKSAMLLPKAQIDDGSEDEGLDSRSELIRQLLEYKKFKDAANLLGAAAEEQKDRFSRPNVIIEQLKPEAEPEVDLEQVSVWDLLEAFDSILEATGGGQADISHISDDTPIDLYQIEILHRLQSEGAMSFARIFEGRSGRMTMIGLFLALLELIRERLIWVEQEQSCGLIFVKSLTEEQPELAVRKAIQAFDDQDEQNNQQRSEIPIKEVESRPGTESAITTEVMRQTEIPISELPPKDHSRQEVEAENTDPKIK